MVGVLSSVVVMTLVSGCRWIHVATLLTVTTCWCGCTRGVLSVVVGVLKLLGIACASCKAFNKSLIDFIRLAAFEMKTEIASLHGTKIWLQQQTYCVLNLLCNFSSVVQ